MKTKPKAQKSFRVWIEQVNRIVIDVKAGDAKEAAEKARRKWKREQAHPRVGDVVEVKP